MLVDSSIRGKVVAKPKNTFVKSIFTLIIRAYFMGNCLSSAGACTAVATTQQETRIDLDIPDILWFKILSYTDIASVSRVRALSAEMRGVVDRLSYCNVQQINAINLQGNTDANYQKQMMLFVYNDSNGRHVDAFFKYNAAISPNTPRIVLKQLWANGDPNVLPVLARNRNTPRAILKKIWMFYGWSPTTVEHLLKNPNTPIETFHDILDFALNRRDDRALEHLASSTCVPSEILVKLAHFLINNSRREIAPSVKTALASHPNMPLGVRISLLNNCRTMGDRILMERAVAPFLPYQLENIEATDDPSFFEACNQGAPACRLDELGKHVDSKIRRAAAGNLNTSPQMLERLARDRDSDVANAALNNPNQSSVLLDNFARRYAFRQKQVAEHPNTSLKTLMWLANIAYPQPTSHTFRSGRNIRLRAVQPGRIFQKSVIKRVINHPKMPFEIAARIYIS